MGYKQTDHIVYIVHWPQINVFKVGSSDHQRWRAFALRGAKIIKLTRFDCPSCGYKFEGACHRAIWDVCRPAFGNATEALPYLGGTGGGYRECFRLPGDLSPWEIAPFIESQLTEVSICPDHA